MFEIVMGIDDFLIQLVKYCTTRNRRLGSSGWRMIPSSSSSIYLIRQFFPSPPSLMPPQGF